ncbi:2-hydroxyacid dehydrogenase [Ignavigranum ruoffiae]|uniref:2-hydroxyacid dehydrogenase n=1 Tax=Ignavigranum ruoffiae TaxID=89093 RepID=UPI0024AC858A|nr:2-hydroxyacid dehydrogenase [Ignavigranum ruoffiae]
MFKIACYGVRENEVEFFNKLNKYDYDLTLYSEYLNHENVATVEGHDAVLLRGNCIADAQNLAKFKEYGIQYVFTRTVGFNHIDVEEAKRLGMKVARVPGYSPNAIAELSLTLGMTLLRNVQYTAHNTSINQDFRVTPRMFSREVRNCTVGIIGTGRIGLTEAKLFKGLGAKVLGYDVFQSEAAKEVVEFVELDDLLAQSDIVSLHVPLIKGENEGMINREFISKMKDDAILINTARGELQDNQAIIDAIRNNELYGFAADVLPGESDVFFKKFDQSNPVPRQDVLELMNLYPRVLLTPHVGSNTDEALTNMIEISYDNFNDVLTKGSSENEL